MRKEYLKELLKTKLSIGLVGKILELNEEEIKKIDNRDDLIKLLDNSCKIKDEKEKNYSLSDNKFYM